MLLFQIISKLKVGHFLLFALLFSVNVLWISQSQASASCRFSFGKPYVKIGGTISATWDYSGQDIESVYIACNHEKAGQGLTFLKKDFFDIESKRYTWKGNVRTATQKTVLKKGQQQCKIIVEDADQNILCQSMDQTYHYDPENAGECAFGPRSAYCKEIPEYAHFFTEDSGSDSGNSNDTGSSPNNDAGTNSGGEDISGTGGTDPNSGHSDNSDLTPGGEDGSPQGNANDTEESCSGPAPQSPFSLSLKNQTDGPFQVFWVNSKCETVTIGTSPEGINTHTNQNFIIKNLSGETLVTYRTPGSGSKSTLDVKKVIPEDDSGTSDNSNSEDKNTENQGLLEIESIGLALLFDSVPEDLEIGSAIGDFVFFDLEDETKTQIQNQKIQKINILEK